MKQTAAGILLSVSANLQQPKQLLLKLSVLEKNNRKTKPEKLIVWFTEFSPETPFFGLPAHTVGQIQMDI